MNGPSQAAILNASAPIDRAGEASRPARSRPVAMWLFAMAVLVFSMVVLGGATRLTGSGLSITRWGPISGALPPVNEKAWSEDFLLYQATPQYRLVNRGMSLSQFKFIFWWEWAHRLAARLTGVCFAVPFALFLGTRALPRRLVWPCAGLLGLGGLQGLAGWWMVESGLEARVSVAPERLATHLGLALILFGALIWTALEAWSGPAERERRDGWTLASALLAAGVLMQCLLGALVAGDKGGLIDNDWPLMAGRLVPSDYWRGSAWGSVVHGPAAAQFDHRIGAYLLFAAALGLGAAAARAVELSTPIRRWALVLLVAVAAQAGLGIATLVLVDPPNLAIAHQAGATLVLAIATALAWQARRT
ncbi:MAG: COX15/CtaA family protein [Caulobacteraceae bacterium]